MNLDTLGAIASGITRGMRSAKERKRLEEDRAFLAAQRQYMAEQIERERRRQNNKDARNASMAADLQAMHDLAKQDAEGTGKMYVVPAPNGALLNFDDPVKAQAFVESANGYANETAKAAPVIPQQRGLQPGAQTTPLPMQKPIATEPLSATPAPMVPRVAPAAPVPVAGAPGAAPVARAPGMTPTAIRVIGGERARTARATPDDTTALAHVATAEAMPVKDYKPPVDANGNLDIQEIVRPKRNGDALFYYGPWRNKYRAEVLQNEGPEAAAALDAHFKAAAEAGYKQRLLEAAELQQAGDMRGVALKLNEIYNRDYVDGNFSNVRFLGDNQIEVVRFTPDGRIVDRNVRPIPDMLIAAREVLTPEERVKLLFATEDKAANWKPVSYPGEAGFYNVVTGAKRTLGPGTSHPNALPAIIAATAGFNRQQDQQAFAAAQAERDRAERARQRQELTAAEKLKARQQDAEINSARRAWKVRLEERKKVKGLSQIPHVSDPDYKLYEMANRPLSTETAPGKPAANR